MKDTYGIDGNTANPRFPNGFACDVPRFDAILKWVWRGIPKWRMYARFMYPTEMVHKAPMGSAHKAPTGRTVTAQGNALGIMGPIYAQAPTGRTYASIMLPRWGKRALVCCVPRELPWAITVGAVGT